ncbi:hypothetical protein MHH60_26285 [Paenibacillus sp. FSL H7-0716]|uniref:Uncharacterized protein n=1 Tax=Paenibacillus odorifer TaxID=189426 RepID=A0AB36J5I5_9BACL|nr:hypothetical protein [Paenibacillus odorifer]OME10558.1 hypothetical protein BSK47_30610 [Paenibacillus odorifer]
MAKFIKLNQPNGHTFCINVEHLVAYTEISRKTHTMIHTTSGSFEVKESIQKIDDLIDEV